MKQVVVPAFSLEPDELQIAQDLVLWSLGTPVPGRQVALVLTDRRLVLVVPDSNGGFVRRLLATASTRRLVIELRHEDLAQFTIGDASWSGPTWIALHDRDGSVLQIGIRDVGLWQTRLERWHAESPRPAPLPEARTLR